MFDCHTKKTFVSSLYWRGTRVHDLQLSGSDCLMLSLDWTFFFSSIQVWFNLIYMPVTKAISSSSALQQHAVLSVKRVHRLKRCFSDHWRASLPDRISFDGGFHITWSKCCFRGLSTPAKINIYTYIYLYPGGNTGLKCLWMSLAVLQNNV